MEWMYIRVMNMTNNKKFNEVSIGDIVTFENRGLVYEAIVSEVTEKTFVVRALVYFQNINGVGTYTTKYYHFHKTGTKTHHRYTHGNAIAITSNINITGA